LSIYCETLCKTFEVYQKEYFINSLSWRFVSAGCYRDHLHFLCWSFRVVTIYLSSRIGVTPLAPRGCVQLHSINKEHRSPDIILLCRKTLQPFRGARRHCMKTFQSSSGVQYAIGLQGCRRACRLLQTYQFL
jgi:hypothetical protein